MLLRSSIAALTALLVCLGTVPAADAAPGAKSGNAAQAEPQGAPPASPPPQAFEPSSAAVPTLSDPEVVPPATAAPAMVKPLNAPQFGGAFRARYISLPRWFLGMFTRASRALSSYGVGLEGFRRKRDPENPNRFSEIAVALGYQNMSPPDGNWLGKGKTAALDTDWVQFKNFGFWTIDISYLGRQYFNEVVGIHYGAGLGLAIVQGDVLRTSSAGCTADNLTKCRPVCDGHVCTEKELKDSEGKGKDYPESPHRFREGSIPAVIPLINLVTGIDFRIPTVPGLEFRLEGGFYNALFLGGAVAYYR